jgi:hypothetical protein
MSFPLYGLGKQSLRVADAGGMELAKDDCLFRAYCCTAPCKGRSKDVGT